MKTAEEAKQNENMMDGVEGTAEATGGTAGDSSLAAPTDTGKKSPPRLSFSNAATVVPLQ